MGIIAKARDLYRGNKIIWAKGQFFDKDWDDKYPQVCIMGALGIALHNGINILEKDESLLRDWANELDGDSDLSFSLPERERNEIFALHDVLVEKYANVRKDNGEPRIYFSGVDDDIGEVISDIIEWNDGLCTGLTELLQVLDLTQKKLAASGVR